MQPAVRALAAFFLVAAASLGGSLYLVHERTSLSMEPAGTGVAASGLAAFLMPGRASDQRLLDTAFAKVEDAYYRPVTAQLLLDGERKELIHFLRGRHVADPNIPATMATGNRDRDIDALNRSLRAAQDLYGAHATSAELTQAAMRGMLASLGDPYTTYLSAAEINALEESLRGGDFSGIGVYIVQDPKTKRVLVEPLEGMPAAKAGLIAGDEIRAVDGKPTAELKLDAVEHLIRGRSGTVVRLTIVRHGNVRDVSVTRGLIYVPSVYAKREGPYEYVRLSDFGQNSYAEVRKAMLAGKEHHARGYILDLRNNPGGLLDAAVDISSLFIPNGTIVSTVDRAGETDTRSTTHAAIGTLPLVVLVNAYSASASEITAGAIQDRGAGKLVGTKTFGKGVVQSIYTLGDGALKITTARYLTPNGRDIHHRGIEPDVIVDQPIEPQIIGSPNDKQLAAARDLLGRETRR